MGRSSELVIHVGGSDPTEGGLTERVLDETVPFYSFPRNLATELNHWTAMVALIWVVQAPIDKSNGTAGPVGALAGMFTLT
jgi:hypothetical protein